MCRELNFVKGNRNADAEDSQGLLAYFLMKPLQSTILL